MEKNETIVTLQSVPLFRSLSAQELERISAITIKRAFPKKSMIFMEGSEKEAVFFIQDGIVKAYKTDENGHEQIVSLLKTGDMFPHTGLFNKDCYPATAETMVDTVVLAIPVQQFEQILLQNPSIAIKVLGVLGEKIRELQGKIQELSGQDVNQRVLSFLLKLAEQYGEHQNGRIQIDVPLTHQEFANAVGTTRETINRLLNHWRKEGIIEIDRNRLLILDIDALKNFR